MNYQPISDFSVDEIIIYLRKSRSDDPALTVEEVLARHEERLQEWAERNVNGRIIHVVIHILKFLSVFIRNMNRSIRNVITHP